MRTGRRMSRGGREVVRVVARRCRTGSGDLDGSVRHRRHLRRQRRGIDYLFGPSGLPDADPGSVTPLSADVSTSRSPDAALTPPPCLNGEPAATTGENLHALRKELTSSSHCIITASVSHTRHGPQELRSRLGGPPTASGDGRPVARTHCGTATVVTRDTNSGDKNFGDRVPGQYRPGHPVRDRGAGSDELWRNPRQRVLSSARRASWLL